MKCLFDADVDIKKKARSKIVMVRIYIDKSKLFESKKVKKRFFDCIGLQQKPNQIEVKNVCLCHSNTRNTS